MDQGFRYNLIRFQPNVETEEFAVVGVVTYSPNTHQLAYRLLEVTHYKRVHDFFHPIDERVLPAALEMIGSELKRVQKRLPEVERPDALYDELIREREDIIRFSHTGSSILGKQAQSSADELFARCVLRQHTEHQLDEFIGSWSAQEADSFNRQTEQLRNVYHNQEILGS